MIMQSWPLSAPGVHFLSTAVRVAPCTPRTDSVRGTWVLVKADGPNAAQYPRLELPWDKDRTKTSDDILGRENKYTDDTHKEPSGEKGGAVQTDTGRLIAQTDGFNTHYWDEELPDGTKIKKCPDSTIVRAPNGTIVETRKDGTRIVIRPDGTGFEVSPGGAVSLRPPPLEVHPPGSPGSNITGIERLDDGTVIVVLRDRTQVVNHTDGSVTWVHPDGGLSGRRADGTTFEKRPDGATIEKDAEGKVIHHTPGKATPLWNAIELTGPRAKP